MPPAVRLLACGRIAPNPGWGVPHHVHASNHELIVPLRGRMRVTFPDQTVEAGAGDLLFYRAGRQHHETSDPADPVETRYLAFTSPVADGWTWTTVADRDGRVRELACWLHREFNTHSVASAEVRLSFTAAIIAECGRLILADEPPLLAAVHAVTDRDLGRPLALGDLAAAAGLSPFHFLRRYRAMTGRTPMAELRRRRVEAARHLVATTDLPLAEIPHRVGLAGTPHLTRLFRQVLGTTPGEIRRSLYRNADR